MILILEMTPPHFLPLLYTLFIKVFITDYMRKILVISVLMFIASLFAYFSLTQQTQESTQISSSIQILPKEIVKDYDRIFINQESASISAKTNNKNIINYDSNRNKEPNNLARFKISGTITNKKGKALEGVLIYSNGEFPPIFSDTNGRYHIEIDKLEFTYLLLNVSLDGYEKQKSRITEKAFKSSSIIQWNLTLADALDTYTKTSFAGKVSNRNAQGVADQRVHLITLGDFSVNEIRYIDVAQTEKNGHFNFRDVSINTNYQLVVLAGNGYQRIEIDDLWMTKETPDIDIILEYIKKTDFSIQVVDREGVPLPNLEVSARSNLNNIVGDKNNQDFVTDDSGVFHLINFPEGETTFNIKSPADIKISGIKLSEMDSKNLTLTVDSGNHFVSGLVTDSDGKIIENATVTLQSTYSKNGVDSLSLRSVTTNNLGTFAFENFGADEHILIIVHKEFIRKMIVHQPHLSGTHHNIILQRP